jgi:hypothetical protein
LGVSFVGLLKICEQVGNLRADWQLGANTRKYRPQYTIAKPVFGWIRGLVITRATGKPKEALGIEVSGDFWIDT